MVKFSGSTKHRLLHSGLTKPVYAPNLTSRQPNTVQTRGNKSISKQLIINQ